jgi:hypothetical protein
VCKRGLDTACKIEKIRENTRALHAKSNTFLHLAKGCLIAFRAIEKGYQIPFGENGMRNPRIACIADNVSNIPLRELNSKFKK